MANNSILRCAWYYSYLKYARANSNMYLIPRPRIVAGRASAGLPGIANVLPCTGTGI